jgi:hypothetical protein
MQLWRSVRRAGKDAAPAKHQKRWQRSSSGEAAEALAKIQLRRSIISSGKDPALVRHWSLSCAVGSERRWVRKPRPATKPGEFWRLRPLRLARALPTGAARACPVHACRATGRDWTLCTHGCAPPCSPSTAATVAGACKPPRVCLKSHREVVSLFDLSTANQHPRGRHISKFSRHIYVIFGGPWSFSTWGKCHRKRCCTTARTFVFRTPDLLFTLFQYTFSSIVYQNTIKKKVHVVGGVDIVSWSNIYVRLLFPVHACVFFHRS